jgi:hypothetical protein
MIDRDPLGDRTIRERGLDAVAAEVWIGSPGAAEAAVKPRPATMTTTATTTVARRMALPEP